MLDVSNPLVFNPTMLSTGTDGGGGEEPPASFSLTARGYKEKGLQKVDLAWSGTSASATHVDIHRDGAVLDAGEANDGTYTDHINRKGGGSYTYKVCEAGTSTCSNEVTVTF